MKVPIKRKTNQKKNQMQVDTEREKYKKKTYDFIYNG